MTAETLKPFITPTSDSFPATHANARMSRRERNGGLLLISVSASALIVATILLGFAIWNSVRVSNLETEVSGLNRVVESMQKRLGLNYLDDLQDFEKEYQNALIDNPSTLDDVVDDDDDDEDAEEEEEEDDEEDGEDSIITEDEYDEIENYDELIKKYNSYDDSDEDENEDDNSNLSDNDNLYDDFEKFKDSRKKKESSRKSRSIAHAPNQLHESVNKTEDAVEEKETMSSGQSHYRSHKPTLRTTNLETFGNSGATQKLGFVSQRIDERRSPLRPRNHRKRYKVPTIKSGESLLSAKSTGQLNALPYKAAAHYHLNQKIPDRHTTMKVESYSGDMYIGHSSWPNELITEPYFQVVHGVLTVREPGLYYIYAQVCYNNTHDQNGFVIFHGHKPFLQCLNTVPTNMPLKIHTCHTSGLIYLQANETIHLRDFHSDRNVILKNANNRSYFGIMKI